MRAEFEEKTYEKYFFRELVKYAKSVYPPGQCVEFRVGFDDGYFIGILQRWRFPFIFSQWWTLRHRGTMLADEIAIIDREVSYLSKRIPRFRLNLFIQYKRPEFLNGRHSAEWSCWRRPYFRYGITKHQQDALEGVRKASNGRAAVVYAAPAFIEREMLFRKAQSRSIIQSSNIVSVNRLTGHSRYSYVSARKTGKVHSDAANVEGDNFDEMIASAGDQDAVLFYEHVIHTARAVETGMNVEDDFQRTLFQRTLGVARSAVFSSWGIAEQNVEVGSFVYALGTIEGLLDAFNLRLLMIADAELTEETEVQRSEGEIDT